MEKMLIETLLQSFSTAGKLKKKNVLNPKDIDYLGKWLVATYKCCVNWLKREKILVLPSQPLQKTKKNIW